MPNLNGVIFRLNGCVGPHSGPNILPCDMKHHSCPCATMPWHWLMGTEDLGTEKGGLASCSRAAQCLSLCRKMRKGIWQSGDSRKRRRRKSLSPIVQLEALTYRVEPSAFPHCCHSRCKLQYNRGGSPDKAGKTSLEKGPLKKYPDSPLVVTTRGWQQWLSSKPNGITC